MRHWMLLIPGSIAIADCSSQLGRGGRGARIRTGGLLLPKQARYQTAPHPAATGVGYTNSAECHKADGLYCTDRSFHRLAIDLDLIEMRPVLAGDEQPVMLGVVRDAVGRLLLVRPVHRLGQQADID